VEDMANALIHLKEHHLVHGDIKPSNIVWDAKTNVYVLVDLDLLNTRGTKVEEVTQTELLLITIILITILYDSLVPVITWRKKYAGAESSPTQEIFMLSGLWQGIWALICSEAR